MIRTMVFMLIVVVPIGSFILHMELRSAEQRADFYQGIYYQQVETTEKIRKLYSHQEQLTWRCIALANSFKLSEEDSQARQSFIEEYISDH